MFMKVDKVKKQYAEYSYIFFFAGVGILFYIFLLHMKKFLKEKR